MDITSMKTLLELQALQNLNMSNESNSSTSSSNSTLFSELMNDLLNSQSLNSSTSLSGLGDIQSLQQLLDSAQANGGNTTSANSYIASFILGASNMETANSLETMPASIEQYITNTDYSGKEAFENFLTGAEKYKDEISKAAQAYNLPEKLIAAVMKQESNFNAAAISSAGASGLMQLMPSTAKYLGVNDRFNPEQNIMGGAKYLRQMLDQFDNDVSTALAAYNAGPGNVKKYNGIPPFAETQNYVKNVINYFNA
jgi:soluble lytic murein transglycosylase-like protein